jgi:uncharacterized membrane protein YjfL (UPF0719 family)
VTLLLLVAARYLIVLTTPFKTISDIVEQENAAIGVVFGAYLIGVAIALSGTTFGRDQDEGLIRLAKILCEGALAIVLVRISIYVNDRFILKRFCIVKELRADRNLGVAFSVAGSCIASGLVLNGALIGFSRNFVYGLRDIVLFWLIGELALALGAMVYHRLKKYDVHELIEFDDNVAVGIGFGAFLASLGLVVRASLVGAGLDSMSQELPRTLLLAVIGVSGVIAIHASAIWFVTARVNYNDEVEMHGNTAVSIVAACASLAAALLFASFIQR